MSQGIIEEITSNESKAWYRFGARVIDGFVFSIVATIVSTIVGVILAMVLPESMVLLLVLVNILISLIVIIGAEGFCLSSFGTTPGKKVFGVVVRKADGSNVSLVEGIKRTVLVLIKGYWLGIPIISLYALYLSKKNFDTTGTTPWDQDCGTKVTFEKGMI